MSDFDVDRTRDVEGYYKEDCMRLYEDDAIAIDLGCISKVEKPRCEGEAWAFHPRGVNDIVFYADDKKGRCIYEAWKAYLEGI